MTRLGPQLKAMKTAMVILTLGIGLSAVAQKDVPLDELKQIYARPDSIPYPEDNPPTKEKLELGKTLFFDPRISGSNMISCATCHNPSFSWGDGLGKGVGHQHKQLGRRTPTLLNLAWTGRMMWDGRLNGLEEQALGPIQSDAEMNMPIEGEKGLIDKLKSVAGYKPLFEKAYPGEEISAKVLAKAIATFERTIISADAPFDLFIRGDESAMSESAKRGFVIFNGKGRCASCHSGWKFTDGSFQDIGLPGADVGRGNILKLNSMQHAFKTPGLRNIALRGPYMHDGSEATLEDVIDLYDKGGIEKRPSLSTLIQPLGLSKSEKADLVEFMKSLTSADKPVDLPVLPR